MKLDWTNDEEIGFYKCTVTDNNGYEQYISVWDYTCEWQSKRKAEDYAYNRGHPEAYEVSYCHGYSMHETFDDSHTLEFVKLWCEDYLLDLYINRYKNILDNLEKIKIEAEWSLNYKNNRLKK